MEGLYATIDTGREHRASGSNTGYNPGRDPEGVGDMNYGKRRGKKIRDCLTLFTSVQ